MAQVIFYESAGLFMLSPQELKNLAWRFKGRFSIILLSRLL
jgi:hypothetical protein